jgi:hypothetical protein
MYTHIHIYVCMYVLWKRTHDFEVQNVDISSCVYIYICVCVCVCVCTRTYTSTHACIHTHIFVPACIHIREIERESSQRIHDLEFQNADLMQNVKDLTGKVIMYVTVSECASGCGPYRQSNNVCDCV